MSTDPILMLDELDAIERYARLYDDVFYGFLPAHPSGRWDAYLPEYREKAIRAMAAVFERRALLQRQEAGEAKAAEIPPMTQDEFQICFDLSNALNIRTHTNPGAISVGECFNLLREAGALSSTPPKPPSRKEIFSVLSKYFSNKRAIHECADSLVALINGAPNAG